MVRTDAMSPPPFDLAGALLRHGHALRALAGQLVRDEHVADDVVQDVWLAALRRPPRHHDSVGGWLATALRNVVRGWRRKERRRAAHEAACAADSADAGSDPFGGNGSREHIARELLRAVEALDPVYRDVVWQRFFEGKPPRAIGASCGVPVATVKSRLQRALGMLRVKFAAGEQERGGTWRRALAAAFGLREGAVAVGTAAAATTGGVLVATWMKGMVVAAVAALAALWCWRQEVASVPGDPARHDVAAAPSMASPAEPPARGEATTALATATREAVATPRWPDPKTATIRGRCVDQAGHPIGDCTVTLRGWLGRAPSSEEWLLEHGAEPIQLRTVPDQDGRFELGFVPPPFTFALTIEGERWAPVQRHWDSLAPGANEDLGEMVLAPGARVRGLAFDGTGARAGDVALALRAASTSERLGQESTARSAADGSFTFLQTLPLGAYTLTADGWTVGAPELVLDRAGTVDVRVELTRPDVPIITGTLVDDADRPVVDQAVAALADGDRVVGVAWPRSDGSFTLLGNQDDPTQPVRLRGGPPQAQGEPTAPMPWGSSGVKVRLRVPPAAGLTVFVGDADGRPLADCTVRIAAADTTRWSAGSPAPLQRTGPDGLVTSPRARPGRYLVFAQFPSSRGLRDQVEAIELDGRPQRVEIRFGTDVSRRVRVQHTDGSPVVGTHVHLCEPWPADLPASFEVRMPGGWFTSNTSGSAKLLVREHGTTDADGAVVLHGPRGRALAMRVLGPGHAVVDREDVRLDIDGDLVVTVASGARVRGRIQPPEAIAELRRLAAATPAGFAELDHRPRLGLRAGDRALPATTMARGTPDLERFVLQEDGRFDLAGLPEGTWEVHVLYWVRSESMTVSQRFPLGTHSLAEGSVLDLAADLTALLPGTIRARVHENGRPLANTMLGLERSPDGVGSSTTSPTHLVKTDGDGRFEIVARPGRYHVQRADGDTQVATPTVELTRGAVLEPTFEFAAGTLHVRLLTADGRPASGVGLHIGTQRLTRVHTDAEGWATATVPPGEHALRVLARRLQQRDAARGDTQPHGPERPAASDWFALGNGTVTAGRTTTLDLQLPAAWDKDQ